MTPVPLSLTPRFIEGCRPRRQLFFSLSASGGEGRGEVVQYSYGSASSSHTTLAAPQRRCLGSAGVSPAPVGVSPTGLTPPYLLQDSGPPVINPSIYRGVPTAPWSAPSPPRSGGEGRGEVVQYSCQSGASTPFLSNYPTLPNPLSINHIGREITLFYAILRK
jgi:hypothetical protein